MNQKSINLYYTYSNSKLNTSMAHFELMMLQYCVCVCLASVERDHNIGGCD